MIVLTLAAIVALDSHDGGPVRLAATVLLALAAVAMAWAAYQSTSRCSRTVDSGHADQRRDDGE